jgi:hypothetical protein
MGLMRRKVVTKKKKAAPRKRASSPVPPRPVRPGGGGSGPKKPHGGKPPKAGRRTIGGPGNRIGGQKVISKQPARGTAQTASGKKVILGTTGKGANVPPITTVQTPYGPINVQARYYQGDEWNPANLGRFADRPRWNQQDLKTALYQFGYYTSGNKPTKGTVPTPGLGWRDTDASAMRRLMIQANSQGMTWEDVLDANMAASEQGVDYGGGSDGGGGGGGGGGGQVASTLDPETIRQLIDTTGQQVTGAFVDQGTREQLLQEILAEDLAAATDETAPYNYDPQANVLAKLRTRKPGEAAVHDFLGVFEMFASMLGEGGRYGSGGGGAFGSSPVQPGRGVGQ